MLPDPLFTRGGGRRPGEQPPAPRSSRKAPSPPPARGALRGAEAARPRRDPRSPARSAARPPRPLRRLPAPMLRRSAPRARPALPCRGRRTCPPRAPAGQSTCAALRPEGARSSGGSPATQRSPARPLPPPPQLAGPVRGGAAGRPGVRGSRAPPAAPPRKARPGAPGRRGSPQRSLGLLPAAGPTPPCLPAGGAAALPRGQEGGRSAPRPLWGSPVRAMQGPPRDPPAPNRGEPRRSRDGGGRMLAPLRGL